MSASSQTPVQLATFADLAAIPESDRFHEILDGMLVQKEATSGEHALTQGAVRANERAIELRLSSCLLGVVIERPIDESRPAPWATPPSSPRRHAASWSAASRLESCRPAR